MNMAHHHSSHSSMHVSSISSTTSSRPNTNPFYSKGLIQVLKAPFREVGISERTAEEIIKQDLDGWNQAIKDYSIGEIEYGLLEAIRKRRKSPTLDIVIHYLNNHHNRL